MAISFPSNPSNGDKFESNSMLYQYDGTNSLWIRLNRKDVSHYTDTTNLLPAQTLQVVNVPDLASLPGSASAGQMMYVLSENKLYLWTGSTWQTMTLAKQNPVLTSTTDGSGGTSPFTLATDGSTTVITMTASHPDSLPLIYNYNVVAGSLTNGGGTTATITQGTGAQSNQFFIQPSTDAAYNGSFTVEFTVSDGEATEVSVGEFTLAISTPATYGTRAVVFNASSGASSNHSNKIEYFDIQTQSGSYTFGNMLGTTVNGGGNTDTTVSNGTRIVHGEFYDSTTTTPVNGCEYVTPATLGSSQAFGTLTWRTGLAGVGDGTYGYYAAGDGGPPGNEIEVITIDTAGNAVGSGIDITNSRGAGTHGNTNRGLFSEEYHNPVPNVNRILYISYPLVSTSSSFGDLQYYRGYATGTGSDTRALFAGGWNPNLASPNRAQTWIEYVTIDTTGNGTDFGHLTDGRTSIGSTSDGSRAVFIGGWNDGARTNIIDYVTIDTTGSASDFGDMLDVGNKMKPGSGNSA